MLIVAFVSFSLFNFVGDPVHNMVGQEASMEKREEIREKFDIGVPVKYKAFCEKYHDEVKMDNIHPEYDDVEWLKVEEQSI